MCDIVGQIVTRDDVTAQTVGCVDDGQQVAEPAQQHQLAPGHDQIMII